MFHDTACLRSCFAGSFVAVKRFFGTWLHACQPGVQCKVYNNYIQPVEINSCHTICQYMRHKKKENSNLIVKDPKYHCLNLRSLCFLTSGVRSVRHVFAIRPSKKKNGGTFANIWNVAVGNKVRIASFRARRRGATMAHYYSNMIPSYLFPISVFWFWANMAKRNIPLITVVFASK